MEVLHQIDFKDNKINIYENTDWFSTTTDSVLLCNFVHLNRNDKQILDFGSGVGTIPLLLALKTDAHIFGIEIQQDVLKLSKKSVLENHLEKRVHLINGDIKNVKLLFKHDSFNVVISNPPYFCYQEEKVANLNIHKKYARHEVAITFEEIIVAAKFVLKEKGRFVFIQRTDRLAEIFSLLKKHQFEPKRLQFIYHTKTSPSKLFLLEASKCGKKELKILPPLYVSDRKEYESNEEKLQ